VSKHLMWQGVKFLCENILSLISQSLNNFYQIKTKVATVRFNIYCFKLGLPTWDLNTAPALFVSSVPSLYGSRAVLSFHATIAHWSERLVQLTLFVCSFELISIIFFSYNKSALASLFVAETIKRTANSHWQ
jgi:hypothetical protein